MKNIVLAGIISTSLLACSKEKGCMDVTADNFNVNAQEDNGNCIPSRDKFIGQYAATGTVTVNPNTTTNPSAGNFKITAYPSAPNAIQIDYFTLLLQGKVEKNRFTVIDQPLGTAIVNANGEYTIVGTDKIVTFTATITYTSGSTIYNLTCTKQ